MKNDNKLSRIEVQKCIDFLCKQPELDKYQYKASSQYDNCENVKNLLYSKVFGGSCLVKRINGKKNSLKTKIEENLEYFSNRIQNAIYD